MTTFDAVASRYDREFTDRILGRWLRNAVWRHLEGMFRPGQRVLELGCGTGEDAVRLARSGVEVHAVDESERMLDLARGKVRSTGLAGRVTFARVDLDSVDPRDPFGITEPGFDGGLSNFGALNCLGDCRDLALALSRWIVPGGRLAVVVMGPLCPWEWLWYVGSGRPRTAFRRLASEPAAKLGPTARMAIRYPSPRRLRTEFAPWFHARKIVGIGVILPPTFASRWVERRPRLFRTLAAADRFAGRLFPGTWLNDHYLIVFERTTARAHDGPARSTAEAAPC